MDRLRSQAVIKVYDEWASLKVGRGDSDSLADRGEDGNLFFEDDDELWNELDRRLRESN